MKRILHSNIASSENLGRPKTRRTIANDDNNKRCSEETLNSDSGEIIKMANFNVLPRLSEEESNSSHASSGKRNNLEVKSAETNIFQPKHKMNERGDMPKIESEDPEASAEDIEEQIKTSPARKKRKEKQKINLEHNPENVHYMYDEFVEITYSPMNAYRYCPAYTIAQKVDESQLPPPMRAGNCYAPRCTIPHPQQAVPHPQHFYPAFHPVYNAPFPETGYDHGEGDYCQCGQSDSESEENVGPFDINPPPWKFVVSDVQRQVDVNQVKAERADSRSCWISEIEEDKTGTNDDEKKSEKKKWNDIKGNSDKSSDLNGSHKSKKIFLNLRNPCSSSEVTTDSLEPNSSDRFKFSDNSRCHSRYRKNVSRLTIDVDVKDVSAQTERVPIFRRFWRGVLSLFCIRKTRNKNKVTPLLI